MMTCEHNMRKMKLSRILLLLLLLLFFAGCTKLVKTEIKTVTVTVSDAVVYPAYTETRYDDSNKRTIIIQHPATYAIYVEYEGKEYALYD